MPYVTPKRRPGLVPHCPLVPNGPGDLNFQITALCKQYLERAGESYQTYNDILGALEGAKLELYARKIRAYENKKMAENGDVY